MNKLFKNIFPQDKKQWKRYFDWVIYESKSVYPIFLILKIILTTFEFLMEMIIRIILVITFPITRIELRIRSNKVIRQKGEKQHD
mgnify:CR=1 FL=1